MKHAKRLLTGLLAVAALAIPAHLAVQAIEPPDPFGVFFLYAYFMFVTAATYWGAYQLGAWILGDS